MELVVHEGGTGKTICAAVWLKDGRDSDALVICPKRVIEKWREILAIFDTKALVISKETFKKTKHRKYSAIVVDEADDFASPLFIAKVRSRLSEQLYILLQGYNTDTPRLLLTATPVRSNPWNLHTLLTFKKEYIDWRQWQKRFFSLERRPYLAGMAWMPNRNWRKQIQSLLKQHADIVLMKDVADLPGEETVIIDCPCRPFKTAEWEPAKRFHEELRNEQMDKVSKIRDIGKEYRKVLVVAYYREQLEQLYKELSKDRETFMVHGGTKNQESVLKQANRDFDECYLLVQASLGAGFDADTFSVIIFASMSYSMRDYAQMKYRVRRIHNLHPVRYFHLHAGRCDRAIWSAIQAGKDFVPSEW